MHQKSLFHYQIKIRGVYRMANVPKEMLLVLMVAAVAVVGLVLLIENGIQTDITGQAAATMKIAETAKATTTAKTTETATKKFIDLPKTITKIPPKIGYNIDFEVENIEDVTLVYDLGNSKIQFVIKVKNNGVDTGRINEFTVDIFAYNTVTVPSWDKGQAFTDTQDIPGGSSVDIEAELYVNDAWVEEILSDNDQEIDIEVYVDNGKDTTESNENNNAWTSTKMVTDNPDYCIDTDEGLNYIEQGSVSGGVNLVTGETYDKKTDSCDSEGKLMEQICYDETTAHYNNFNCEDVVGQGYTCSEGACVR